MKKERIRNLKQLFKILRTNGYRNPMQIILDADFMFEINKMENGMNVLLRYFEEFPKIFIPACEYEKYKKKLQKGTKENEKIALGELSGHTEIIKCDCADKAECLYQNKIIKGKNTNHYIVATNKQIYQKIYKTLNVPVLKIVKCVPTFDLGDMKKQIFDYKGKEATGKELKALKKMFG